jgi:hypothetical protein
MVNFSIIMSLRNLQYRNLKYCTRNDKKKLIYINQTLTKELAVYNTGRFRKPAYTIASRTALSCNVLPLFGGI